MTRPPKINPGTIMATAAALMAQGENLSESGEIFSDHWTMARERRIRQFVELSIDLALETEKQLEEHHAQH